MKKLTGAITAIVTPFTKTGSVDIAALKKLVQFQLAAGISGIVPCGSTGEAMTLTLDEYALVIKTVASEVQKKVPVIAGAGSNDTDSPRQRPRVCRGSDDYFSRHTGALPGSSSTATRSHTPPRA